MTDITDGKQQEQGNGEFIGIVSLIFLFKTIGQHVFALWVTRVLIGYLGVGSVIALYALQNLSRRRIHNDDWYLGVKDIEMTRPLNQNEYLDAKSDLNRGLLRGVFYLGVTLLIYYFFLNK